MFNRKRFPISYQLDTMDCGPSCLEMIARHHGRRVSKQLVRSLCQQDRQGTSLAGIARAAEALGFRTLAVKVSFDDLKQKAPLPCIAFWPHGHFVVIHRIRGNSVYLADPAAGLSTYTKEEFETCWLDPDQQNWGVILLLEPTKQLLTVESKPAFSAVSDLWWPLWRDVRRHLLPLGIGIAVLLFAQLVLPFLSAAVVDAGVLNRNLDLVFIILLAQLVLLFSRMSVNLLQECMLAYIGVRIDMRLVSQFLMKLTRLPLSFFDGKLIGDLLQRINDHKALQQLLTGTLWQVLLATLSLAVFGAALALFQPLLFAVYLAGSAIYVGYIALFIKRQRLLNFKTFHLSAQKQGMVIEFLAGMQEIKLNNAEQQRRWQWEAAQHAIGKIQVRSQLLNHVQGTGGLAINEIKNLVLTLLVAQAVIRGEISLGTMVAVQYVIGQLSWPLNQIAMLIAQSHEAALSYLRAKEIHQLSDEEDSSSGAEAGERSDIEFRNVSFGYGGTSRSDLFRNLSFNIPAGKTTAIVGRSGSGKTTLLRLILKFYSPDGGEILLGGVNLNKVSHRQWRNLCGIVMQDGYIFSDTVAKNIAVADEHPDMERVTGVARLAEIHTFLESLPLGYETRIGRDGVGISRGQAQRILIARALYKDPKYLFFDEATSALDGETESLIVDRLREIMRGKTAVVIAHRMSTVRDADQIILVDGGEVVEVGTHEELVGCRGSYYSLVRNQLDLGE
jgi:ATP-binding cassette subfamily B protein